MTGRGTNKGYFSSDAMSSSFAHATLYVVYVIKIK